MSNSTLREKEGQAFYFLSAAAIPFLFYLLWRVYTPETDPIEYWLYLVLAVYDFGLFFTATIKKNFRRLIRPFIVYAMPIAALVQYINMYMHGPSASNMLGSIGCMVYASALMRHHSESLFYLFFFSLATIICVSEHPTPDMLIHYTPCVVACLLFLGISQFFKIQNSKIQIEKSQLLSNSLVVWTHVLENANVTMALTDLDGVVIDISERRGARKRADVIGKTYEELIPPDQRGSFCSALARAGDLKKATTFKTTYRSDTEDDKTFSSTVWPVIESDEVIGFMFFVLDISAEHIIDQNTQQNAQLTILGELSATIAHEIRNPLTVISGNLEVMLGQIEKGISATELLPRFEKLKLMTERIGTIVTNVRRMYHAGEDEPLHNELLAELVKDATSFCMQKCREKAILLTIVQVDPALEMFCKPLLVSQAILNLLHNAIDAIGTYEEKWIRIEVVDLSTKVMISVVDSGKGIPQKVLNNIGKPFFTTKSAGKGNGLGINLAKRVVDEHGGEFCYDQDSKNTKFDLIFPKNKTNKEAA